MAETGFEIVKVTKWSYSAPQALRGSRSAAKPMKDSPLEMVVRCKACGTQWTARKWPVGQKPGTFYQMPFGYQITCGKKSCEQDETVANTDIPE